MRYIVSHAKKVLFCQRSKKVLFLTEPVNVNHVEAELTRPGADLELVPRMYPGCTPGCLCTSSGCTCTSSAPANQKKVSPPWANPSPARIKKAKKFPRSGVWERHHTEHWCISPSATELHSCSEWISIPPNPLLPHPLIPSSFPTSIRFPSMPHP